GEPARLPSAAVRGLHHARTAAGHDRPAVLGEAARDRARADGGGGPLRDGPRAGARPRGAASPTHPLEPLTKHARARRQVALEGLGGGGGREDAAVFHQRRCWVTCVATIPSKSRVASRP